MKIKPYFKELEINTVPLENLSFSHDSNMCLLVDDINEKRWKITFVGILFFKVISMDLGYSFNSIDFKEYHYCINQLFVQQFLFALHYIPWIKRVL